MKKNEYYNAYCADCWYQNEDIATYNGVSYIVDIPEDIINYSGGIINETPGTSRCWKLFNPEQREIKIRLRPVEAQMITSCIKMAFKEGLYGFDNDEIKHSDKDMLLILMKLGVEREEAEAMIKYC